MRLNPIIAATLTALGLVTAEGATAAPVSLGGMGIVGQWTDYENQSGEMPVRPWGNSDTLHADSVGIYVEYANGLTGSATYHGLANRWGNGNSQGFAGIAPDTATGFFASFTSANYAYLHILDNTGFILPMAWIDLRNAFTGNFDISYENQRNSTWRADAAGWQNVQITLYSSAATAAVPEPASFALAGLALCAAGFASRRRRA